MSNHFVPSQHNNPSAFNDPAMQYNEPSQAKPNPIFSRPPPNFNFPTRPNGPPPFPNINAPHSVPPSSNFNSMSTPSPFVNFNPNHPPPIPFSNINVRPTGPPPPVTFHTTNNRPPPFVDTIDRTDRPYGMPERHPMSVPFTNSPTRPPFPNKFNARQTRPHPSQFHFENRPTNLPPPNANFHSNVTVDINYSSNDFQNSSHLSFTPGQLQSRLPVPSPFVPSLNNSLPPVGSCPPSMSPSLHSQKPLWSEQTTQPFHSTDGSSRSLSKRQNQHPFERSGLHSARGSTKEQSQAAVAASSTAFGASPSFNAPLPSRHEKDAGIPGTCQSGFVSGREIPFHPLHNQVISVKKDQDWVNKWLEQREKQKGNTENAKISKTYSEDSAAGKNTPVITNKTHSGDHNILKLTDIHRRVAKYRTLVEELRQCHHTGDKQQTVSVKVQLDEISSQLLDPSYQSSVERLVVARRKKRARAKQSRKLRLQRWQEKSNKIDQQRELLCRQYKEEDTQKRLVSEADAVLREVRGKKEETVSLQLLLAALRDLRQHRLNKGDQQGYVTTHQHTQHFHKVTDGLDEMLESQLQDYDLEERTLRAMLDQQRGTDHLDQLPCATQEHGSNPEAQVYSLKERLFGCAAPSDPALFASYTAADTSREMLLSRRFAWDKLVCEVGGTGIPVSWVTPPDKPSNDWEKWIVQP